MNHDQFQLLGHLADRLQRLTETSLQMRLGIGYSQYKILTALQSATNLQQRQIAEQLGQTEASVSRQIKAMVRHGLLNAAVNPLNRRERRISLTPLGAELLTRSLQVIEKEQSDALGALPLDDARSLGRHLTVIHERLCTPSAAGACNYFTVLDGKR